MKKKLLLICSILFAFNPLVIGNNDSIDIQVKKDDIVCVQKEKINDGFWSWSSWKSWMQSWWQEKKETRQLKRKNNRIKKQQKKSARIRKRMLAKAEKQMKQAVHKENVIEKKCDPFDYYYHETKDGITVMGNVLSTQRRCIKKFGTTGKYLTKKRKSSIYPIELTIQNDSSTPWTFHTKDTNLKIISERYVLKRLLHKTKLRTFFAGIGLLCGATLLLTLACPTIPFAFLPALGIPEVFCNIIGYPLSILPESIACITSQIGIGAGATMVAATPLVCGMRGESLERSNQSIKQLIKKLSKKTITIEPGEKETVCLFVRHRHYKKRFPVSLTNNLGEKLSFNCMCQPV